ncbi:Hint domain-containing protein [Roseicyclus mahoneyensis]|uniref:Ca2+-binding RTX toxin-like protein n=1 Tax=Roseicyclus mahoneyensis TaxID=164332 RepID=A0A316GNY1_9RHOB|nr:Hint domain-containing protein [Roseicyclus mahoneyensis]PWK61163.1 Ca2+-binding RTX toxin-like protein [Roseicyclus mahoneyensis]
MPNGYLVSLGANGALDDGDVISGALITFTTSSTLGAGSWSWSGTWSSSTFTNAQEPGVYYLATDGNVYFVPDFGPVATLTTAATITTPVYEPGDGVIEGTDSGDLIDGSYADDGGDAVSTGADTVRGFDGDDTISAGGGNDLIFGDGGDDSILGGDGADTIWGDTGTSAAPVTGVLRWNTAQNDNQDVSGGITLTSGPIDATVSFSNLGNNNPTYLIETTDSVYVGAGEPFGTNSSLYLFGNGDAATSRTEIRFDANDPAYAGAVGTVSFRINDFDWGSGNHRDTVTIRAFDANGNAISYTLTYGANAPTTGANQTISSANIATSPAALNGSLLVQIPGPVDRIEIDYSNGLNGTQAIWISDIAFTALPAEAGDDTIDGGTGNDLIYGEGGNDSILGGGGADTVEGGAGNDTIRGGDGNDLLAGGTGADVIFGDAGNDTIMVGQGDSVTGGDGDDLFILTDTGDGPANMTITGGEGGETLGDVLDLNGLNAGPVTYTSTTPGNLAGFVTLLDGSVLTFSEIEDVICFTPGTRILTPAGERPIETLRPGDLVVTRDDGPQPIRWIGARTGPGTGKNAPIRIAAGGPFHATRPLLVSPQHRVLVQGYRAQLIWGEDEVLVAARHLVDHDTVRVAPQTAVTYIHMVFDRHQIVYAEGAAVESLHLGDEGLRALSPAGCADLFATCPGFRADPCAFGPTARVCARSYEARLLAA